MAFPIAKITTKAVTYGDQSLLANHKPQHVTVILNPVAKKRKAKKLFEKYCEPILHLAGYAVTIIQTQSENQARNLIGNLNNQTDIIIVAGGDGTLSDVVTGMMRKYKHNSSAIKELPIGILPLGKTNKVADSLFHGYPNLVEVRKLTDATIAILRGKTKFVDVLEVELLEKDAEHLAEPIYAVGSVEWGAWNDAHCRSDKYWYLGILRTYVTYIFSGFKSDINWDCNGVLRYFDPCSGCSNCHHKQDPTLNKRWWHSFVPKIKQSPNGDNNADHSKIINKNCSIVHEIPISTTELHIKTENVKVDKKNMIPSLKVELGPPNISYMEFVTEGWRRLNGQKTLVNKTLEAREIEIHPSQLHNFKDKERSFYIDNEEFELKPVKLKLIPKTLKIFYPKDVNTS
ncbi:acylglycerol kinase, mitochondrial isoform X2 [Phymastichus coffea]|uniref:acylglycerol kinase, mitochondrial isoform X2 n=1 Tax=Phymastichus coffea TaxID=108790 RepID=UPI00273BD360|nr:acylglycerol kinase, mitochondrial isoform X2 [Phymastichus coffea]